MRDSNAGLQRRDLELPAGTVSLIEVWPQPKGSYSFAQFRAIVDLFAGPGDELVSLLEPVDWIELRQRFLEWPDEDLQVISRLARMPHCIAHSLGAKYSCVRLSELYRDEPERHVTVDAHGVEVPRDRRVAMIEKGEELFDRSPDYYPLIIGTDEAIRMLASAAPGKFPPTVHRARGTQISYARFQHLWGGVDAAECFSLEGLIAMRAKWNELTLACGIGKTMGTMHAGNMLHGDAHTRNFVVQMMDDAITVDNEDAVALIPDLTTAQCAADISSLLSEMDRPKWLAFRAGYLYRWPAGQPVIELMEGGPAKTPAMREDELALNFARALSLTGNDTQALALYQRVMAEHIEQPTLDPADIRAADAALLARVALARIRPRSAVWPVDKQ